MNWKDIEGLEKFYQVSDTGKIRNWMDWKVLCQNRTKQGSCRVSITDPDTRKRRSLAVHITVAKAFIPNPEGFKYVCHKNGNRKDNSVGNLYWSEHKGGVNNV